MVVTTGDTELSLFTTTLQADIVLVGLSELCNGVNPVGVLVKVGVVGGTVALVGELHDVGCEVALARVEVGFFHHHGVTVTVEHLHASGLPAAGEEVVTRNTGLTLGTTAGGNFDNTVRTTGTPHGAGTGVLLNFNALDVLHVYAQQVGKLFGVVHVLEVDVGGSIVLKDVSVNDNQRFLATTDGGDTTQTHAHTGTEVTGIGHDVKTGDLSLQSLVGRFEGETLHFVHIQFLGGY